MDYEAFKRSFLDALARSRVVSIGVERLRESLDLRSTDRTCCAYVEGPTRDLARAFHVTGEVSWRWRAAHSARTATTEEDLLSELLGGDAGYVAQTEPPAIRMDVKLHATAPYGQGLAMPTSWKRWRRDVANKIRLIPDETSRMGANLRTEILGGQGDPALTAECTPAGELRLQAVELPAFQIVRLPRRWDDSDREPDADPHAELAAMFERLSRGLFAWGDLVGQLVS